MQITFRFQLVDTISSLGQDNYLKIICSSRRPRNHTEYRTTIQTQPKGKTAEPSHPWHRNRARLVPSEGRCWCPPKRLPEPLGQLLQKPIPERRKCSSSRKLHNITKCWCLYPGIVKWTSQKQATNPDSTYSEGFSSSTATGLVFVSPTYALAKGITRKDIVVFALYLARPWSLSTRKGAADGPSSHAEKRPHVQRGLLITFSKSTPHLTEAWLIRPVRTSVRFQAWQVHGFVVI